MITVVTWLWSQNGKWPKYNQSHVYRLKQQLDQNTTVPFRFVCVTDGTFPLDGVETHPLPNLGLKASKWREDKFPQCFNRLWAFSEEAGEIFGGRFVSMDLDCQITGNIDSILSRKEDFIINKGDTKRNGYSGSMWMMDVGARKHVWEDITQKEIEKASAKYTGSDQAWIRYILGPDEAMFTSEDGVYHYHYLHRSQVDLTHPPEGCKIMFFAGRTKPEVLKYSWIT